MSREIEQALERELRALRRRRTLLPMGLPAITFLLLLAVLAVDLCGSRLRGWWIGERTWSGARRYVPAVNPSRDIVTSIDLRLLHEQLLPRWSLALGWGRESSDEQAAFLAAFVETSKDPNLARLLAELRQVARTDAARQSQRVEYLGWAWNEYLSSLDLPFHIECNVAVGPGRNRLIIQSYTVRKRAQVHVGGETYPLRILDRIDHLNLDDDALGRTGIHGGTAQVLLDGVEEYAALRVWPLLHDLSAHGTQTDSEFSRAVSAEVKVAIDPRLFAVLARTAPSFRALLMMRESIQEREDCGSRLRIKPPPPEGYPPSFRAQLIQIAEIEQESTCPAVTLAEAATIDLESAALARARHLRPALAALADHLVRGVAIHEARHVADSDRLGIFRSPLPCRTCPEELRGVPRAEVSAYLASFTDEGTGYSSLHQACRVATGTSANAVALGYLLPRLLPNGCEAGPPADLHVRARALEEELFGRSSLVTIE